MDENVKKKIIYEYIKLQKYFIRKALKRSNDNVSFNKKMTESDKKIIKNFVKKILDFRKNDIMEKVQSMIDEKNEQ